MHNTERAFITVFKAADIVGLKYLITSLETLTNPENPESESEGYLLEKSVKETVSDVLQKIKLPGKKNQVEEAGADASAG